MAKNWHKNYQDEQAAGNEYRSGSASRNSRDDLQRTTFQLTITSEAYDMKRSSEKIKTTAFKGKDEVRSKIVIN